MFTNLLLQLQRNHSCKSQHFSLDHFASAELSAAALSLLFVEKYYFSFRQLLKPSFEKQAVVPVLLAHLALFQIIFSQNTYVIYFSSIFLYI